jgi:hypothetical protein
MVDPDEIQMILEVLLRELAGKSGLAYLLRRADFFPKVYFPVACSWDPPCSVGEGDLRHLANYPSFPYVFENLDPDQGSPKPYIEQAMPDDLETLTSSWLIECLFLSRGPDLARLVSHEKNSTFVDGDLWIRRCFDLSGQARARNRSYLLVIGGPAGEAAGVRKATLEALRLLLGGDAWPRVSRGRLAKAGSLEEVHTFLLDYLEDNFPAPPDWNAPVFSVTLGERERYGINRLAFSCYLAWRKQLLRRACEEGAIPKTESLHELILNPSRVGDKVATSWKKAIAHTPHLLGMLKHAAALAHSPFYEHYEEDGRLIATQSGQLIMEVDPGVPASAVLNLLESCQDMMTSFRWSSKARGDWVFWLRANHVRDENVTYIAHHQSVAFQRFDSDSAVEVVRNLWDKMEPKSCDLLNALWAVKLRTGSPTLIMPLFMRFHHDGREKMRDRLIHNPPPAPSSNFSTSVGRIVYKAWIEEVNAAEALDEDRAFIDENARAVLEEAERNPFVRSTPEDRLLDFCKRAQPHRYDTAVAARKDVLGHDWEESPTQRERIAEYLRQYHLLSINPRHRLVQPLFMASKHLHDTVRAGRAIKISPLAVLLVTRLVEVAESAVNAEDASDWLRRSLGEPGRDLEVMNLGNGFAVGRATGDQHWWALLARFLRSIRWNSQLVGRKVYESLTYVPGESGGFVFFTKLANFAYEKFMDRLLSDPSGNATGSFAALLAAVGESPAEALDFSQVGKVDGVRFYLVRNDVGRDARLILAAGEVSASEKEP